MNVEGDHNLSPLFATKPMAEIINQEPVNTERLQELIDGIEPHEGQLNARSRAFLLLGRMLF